jgi:signal transduction histidine kinase/CheY-like chemotaxis protein
MSHIESLTMERRARLAAERLFERRQAELAEANQKIATHARRLSDEFVVKRQEAEALRQESRVVRHDLERAQEAMHIAERRLWDSVETIRDGFAVFDADFALVAANSAFLAPFEGLSQVGAGIGYEELLLLAAEEGLVDTGTESRGDWVVRMVDRWRQASIEPVTLRFWNGQFARIIDRRTRDGDMVTLALDITSTMRRERALKGARAKAEAANRAKSAFLANMSHEIRTPMNGVVGMADILLETPLTEDQRLYIQTIRNSGEALLSIINDVLDYSKIEARRLTLHPAPFDLENTIQEVLTLLTPTAQGKGLALELDYDLFLPTRLVGDQGRIRQALTNLIGNAVKFTQEGSVTVRVVGRPGGVGFRHVTVAVEDTGIGIAPAMQRHVFGEFNQVEDEMNRRFDGTGLGLAITKSLIELMSGDIWVNSELGKGSCFSFRIKLPVADSDGGERRISDWFERAVLIDPDDRSRQLTTSQLIALGLPVASANDLAALRCMRIGPRDILVMSDTAGERVSCPEFRLLMDELKPALALLLTRNPGCSVPEGCGDVRILRHPVLRQSLLEILETRPGSEAAPDDRAPPPEAGPAEARPAEEARPHEVSPDEEAPPPEAAPAAEAPQPEPPPPEAPVPERRLRLLAAEDNKTNQLVFAKMLGGLDIELHFADDGVEAVEKYVSLRPDVVFTDISMPRMDGKEAAARIREIEAEAGLPRVPIIAMTAHALGGDAEAILASGMDHYLTKPLRKAHIVAHIVAAAGPGILPPQRAAAIV